jgi:molybdopterin-guanine dinucleotide biosynthesis protein A
MKDVVGVVLAGGRSSRMGAEKALLALSGIPLVERVTARLRAQVEKVVIGANGDPDRFRRCAVPVVPDTVVDCGPIGGLLTGLLWARSADLPFVLTVACDTPFFPVDLARRLLQSIEHDPSRTAVARSDGHDHYTFALHPTACLDDLLAWLDRSADRSLRGWLEGRRPANVEFEGAPAPFFNINAPMDLVLAETWVNGLEKYGRPRLP